MNKVITIFLLSCSLLKAQEDQQVEITRGLNIRLLGSSAATGNDASESTGSYIPRPNTILVAIVINTKASAPDQPNTSGNSITWTEIFDTNYISTHRLTVWTAKTGSGSTRGTFTADTGATSQTGWAIAVIEVSGGVLTGTDGTNGIIQRINASGTGTSLTGTFGTLGKRTLCIGLMGGNLNSAAYSAESGWTLLNAINYNTPATSNVIVYQLKNSDTTCTVSHGSSFTGCIVGLEFGQLGIFP